MKNKVVILRTIYFFILVFGLNCLNGCAIPVPIEVSDEITSTHCIFEYDGSLNDIYSKIKREVAGYNFVEFQPDDRNSALLVTNFKSLPPNEKYNINLFFSTPTSLKEKDEQDGRLVFIFTEMGNKTQIEFYTITQIKFKVHAKQYPSTPVGLPHPMLIKYKEIIREMPNVKLISD